MKRILTLLLMMVAFYSSKAQWVSIPDSNFGKWLTINHSNCMQGNPQIGFQMDTSCSEILSSLTEGYVNSTIKDLTGIQYFKSLKYLSINTNQLTKLPKLSDSLIYLNCSSNFFTTLPDLPPSITTLDCSNNLLTSLSNLPTSLLALTCSYNPITSISSLPSSLLFLECSHNSLNTLPSLPNSIDNIQCENNNLTSLPNLPSSLVELNCNSNQLSSLPNLPIMLNRLYCFYNKLSFLPNLPISLRILICYGNQLNSLPSLPSSLEYLDCSKNSLSSIPILPSSLVRLHCGKNQISFLPVLPSSLLFFYCDSNHISTLPVLPISLKFLSCSENQITGINNIPASLRYLDCRINKLSSITNLPDSLYEFSCSGNENLNCLPKLNKIAYFSFIKTGINCLPNYPKSNTYSYPSIDTIPLCNLSSGCPVYWNISGNVHEDTASACFQDSIAPGKRFQNFKAILSKGGVLKEQMYVTSTGEYSFDTDSLTNYEVSIDTVGLPIAVKCPITGEQSVAITASDSIKGEVNFGLKCKGYDVGVNSIYSRFRSGRLGQVTILAGDALDLGCTGNSSAIVTTTISGSAHYVSPAMGALTPTTVVGNTLTYNIADVSTIKSATDFNILVQTDNNAVLGSSICVTTIIHTPTPDYIPANDSLTICFSVVNSFDPNEKTVYPKNISQDATWLNYTIQFQNTGNDTAYDIVIRDTLSANLDLESFQYLASSHSPIVQVKGREAIFTFANINLLDSFHNEPQSHGWLQYRIKTKANLPLQSQIKNTAYIYFDFNSPVVTNTTLNTIDVTGITEIQKAEPFIALYPNPASGLLNISTNSLHPKSLTIYDASGRKVSEQAFTTSLDISNLSQGIYLLEVKSEEGIARRRFVRQ